MRENFSATRPVLLEPVMKIEIECPTDFQGSVVGNLTSRRGMVVGTEVSGAVCRIEGDVPLSETFGYSTDLRSMTQGQGTFTMEFAKYRRMPGSIEREVIAARKLQVGRGIRGFPRVRSLVRLPPLFKTAGALRKMHAVLQSDGKPSHSKESAKSSLDLQ